MDETAITGGDAADRRTILLIDDAESHRKLYSLWLTIGGYAAQSLGDERKAQRIAEEVAPHAILVDIRLPFVSGVHIIRSLKTAALTRHIPVMAFTVMGEAEGRDVCLAAGADIFICKPSSMAPFLTAVGRLFEPAG